MKKIIRLIICYCFILCAFSSYGCSSIDDKRKIEEQLAKDCNYPLKIVKIERLNDYQLPRLTGFIFALKDISVMRYNLAKSVRDYYLKKLTKNEIINVIDSIEMICNNYNKKFQEACFLWDGSYDILHKDTIIPVIDGSRNYRLTVTDGHKEVITYAKILANGSIETAFQLTELVEEYINAKSELYIDIFKYKYKYNLFR